MIFSFEHINQVLQEADIEGLISDGAPNDEYGSEAKEIHTALNALKPDEKTEEAVMGIIVAVFAQSFGRDIEEMKLRIPDIQTAARRMLAAAL